MPIAASLSILQTQIKSAMSMRQAAQTSISAQLVSGGVAMIVPTGILPLVPPVPLVPIGLSAGSALISQGLSMSSAATAKVSAQMIASGVSMIAPLAPPAGLSLLTSQLESAFSMKQAATTDMVSQLIAMAIISYYTAGGIL